MNKTYMSKGFLEKLQAADVKLYKKGKQFKNVLDPRFAELIPGFLSNSFKLFRLQHLIVLNYNRTLCLAVIRVASGCF